MAGSKSVKKRPLSAVAAMMAGVTADDLLNDDDLDIDLDIEDIEEDDIKEDLQSTKTIPYKSKPSNITEEFSPLLKISCDKIDLWQFTDRSELSMGDQEKLKMSIKELGQNQPALVRKKGERFELIFGHRRFKACQALGIYLLCKVCSLDNEKAALIQISENVDREDINDFDRGANFEKLLSNKVFSNIKELAEKTHFAESKLYELMTFSKIPFHIKKMVNTEKLSSRTSSDLCSLTNDKKYEDYSDEIVKLVNENPIRRDLRKCIDAKIRPKLNNNEDRTVELNSIIKSKRKDRVILTVSLDNKNLEKVAEIEKGIEQLLSEI
jgi:ParB family transcriptional regulator, chromosome partitioning protein